MKNITTFIVLVVSFAGMAQGVTITTDKTATQLINEVLISPTCNVAAENVISSTGNTAPFGSTNGIGYFTNISPINPNLPYNSNFPFKSGVVLTTGNVMKVPSPNNAVLSDGIATWPGDTEMQTALAAQGITINSINASYIQFEFIATTQTFNLDFIFASEEYGASQCNYSDAFAFLIKNLTDGGTYQNVATVPTPAIPGTPITVDKIRDALYNPNCSSVNKEFFGAYNGSGFGPAINFNGQTIPMTAAATLIVGKRYRVKLVIADGNNNVGYDSAIFLEAKTLNIGGEVLGLDYVSSNAGATPPRPGVCPGGTFPTLQPETALPANTIYLWKKYINGTWVSVTGGTSASLNLNTLSAAFAPNLGTNTTYSLTYTRPGCVAITDEITVQSFPAINALAAVPPLYKCLAAGATTYNFVFGSTADIILHNNTAFTGDDLSNVTITFHTSPANANANIAITNIDITGNQGQLPGYDMYAKITNNTSGCYEIRNFKLLVVAPPTIVSPPLNLTLCAISPAAVPRAVFNFTDNINLIRGTVAQNPDYNAISFYYNQPAAIAGIPGTAMPVDPITHTINLPSSTVWVRFQNISNPDCYIITSFTVTVTALAYVDILPDVIVCANFVLPDLTQANATYWDLTGGPTGGGNQLFATNVITPGATTPTTIWVYNENGNCKTNDSFKVTAANLPVIAPTNSTHCQTENYALPALAYGKYYKNGGGPANNPLPSDQLPAGYIINTPGPNVLYVWFENLTETPTCGYDQSFTITITPFTNLDQANYPNQFDCNSYTFNPTAVAGVKYYSSPGGIGPEVTLPFTFNTAGSKTIYVYKQSPTNSNCTSEVSFTIYIGLSGGGFVVPGDVNSCTPYTLPTLDFGEYHSAANGGGTQYNNGDVISTIGTTTIYFYVPGQVCTGNLSFTVKVSLPAIDPIIDVPQACDQYTFPYIAGHPNGKYYTQPLGQGVSYNNSSTSPGVIYTQGTQTIYFYEQSTSGSCYVQDDFQLTINPSPPLSQRPNSVVTCNQAFVLDDLQFGEYYKLQGGPTVTNNPILPIGTPISSNDLPNPYSQIWAYSFSTNPLNTCHQEYSIKIYLVNTTVNPIADVTACDSYELLAIVGPGKYYPLPGGPLVPGNTPILPPYNVPSKLITTTKTLYVYAEDNNRVPCSDQDAFTVTILRTPDLNPVAPVTVCDSFTVPPYNDPMFTFTATNPGVITKFYKNPGGAAANTLPIDVYTPGQVITNTNGDFSPKTITLYPYAELLGAPAPCFENQPFVVTINRTPIIVPAEVLDVNACDTYTLPALTIGKYYSSAAHTQELTGAQLILTNATNTVYVYAETGTTPNCFAPVEDIVVTIITTPVLNAIAPVASCDIYTVPQYSDPMFTFSATNPGVVTKFYKNAGGPASNPLATDEYLQGQSIPNNGTTPLIVTMYAYSAIGPVPCFDDEPFVVTINKSPVIVAAEVVPITRCDGYTLPALTVGSYFSDALHTTPITNLSLTGSQTIYVYAETATNPNCTDSDSFAVTIVPTPTVSAISPIASCDTYIVPSYSDPMFTSSSPITKFYKNAGGPTANPLPSDEYTVGQIIQNTTTTPLVVTIYAYTQVGSVPCFANAPLVVTINKSPVIVASEVQPITRCDSYTLPPLTVGNYFSNALHTNPITILTLTTSQTVYVYAVNGIAPDICSDSDSFLVTINNTPQFTAATVADVSTCNSYTLPVLSLAGAKYYTGNNATGTEITLPQTYTSDTTIFAYAETATTPNCFVSESINIQIYNVIKLQDVTICGGYTLPNLADPNANYYAFSGGSGLIAAGTTLTASQTVFVRGTGPSGCTDESDFIVTINGQPIANDASDTVCDNDSSPYDGITPYDLTTLIPSILGTTQAPTDFTVTFYADFNRTVQILTPTACTLPIVYVFVTNNLSSTCPSPAIVTISVIPLPNPKLDVPPICIDSETGIVTNSVIESGYNSLQYSIVWTKSDGTVVSNNQTFSTDIPGAYILNVASNAVTTCASAPVPFTVIESAKPAVTPPITFDITGWFTNSQTITVNATPYVGDGSNFAYSLDGQTPQDDKVFYNVGPGVHEITVIDKNGCGTRSLPIPVELVTSPAAFTPNGDGINDRWDIKGEVSYSTLTIYDRFGRMLKQLNQNSGGWDGTINSQTLPADDYWFSVNYIDSSGAAREYKSHFSLIR